MVAGATRDSAIASRCCSNCDSKQLCVHELDDKPKGAIWPKYCPKTIEALMTKLKLPKALHRR
jgi:hypothetical protein